VRIALIASGIGQGLSSLPAVLLPYTGINPWTHVVILLGAGVLLLDAAVSLAFAGQPLTELRRAGAALPLIALGVIPSTLVRPHFPYLQGLLLFGLIAAFMWGERIPRGEFSAVAGICAIAGAGGMILAPGLDQHRPWINYQALAGGLAPSSVDTFDWSQTYGPIVWPRKGRAVLDVAAGRAEYWKAENLDMFDGREWVTGSVSPITPLAGVDHSARARWTQTLQVTVRTMKTGTILAAGAAGKPEHVPGPVFPGASQGTWIASNALAPGDSYRVTVYSPHPNAEQLARAGTAYPDLMGGYRTIELGTGLAGPAPPIRFPPFHSRLPVKTGPLLTDSFGAAVVESSPYAPAYRLARTLAARAATPYAFVAAVERYLSNGFAYDESPPQSAYPLETFLFQSKLGYCQQFAGAMALLLRMGGVPARVSAGFTSGTYDRATRQWVVSDIDAHAWVEAWFPHYGWVRFDPTPPADPALGGHVPITPTTALGTPPLLPKSLAGKLNHSTTPTSAAAARHSRGASPLLWLALLVAGLAVAGLLVLVWRAGQSRGIEQLLAELERAMARTGRPIAGGITLAGLERRVRGRPEAEGYIRALRLARFGSDGELPTLSQRRALRAELRAGLGLAGALRALWALPPRWSPPRTVSRIYRGA
jgi:transglutaminase-like putative cysteine protease